MKNLFLSLLFLILFINCRGQDTLSKIEPFRKTSMEEDSENVRLAQIFDCRIFALAHIISARRG